MSDANNRIVSRIYWPYNQLNLPSGSLSEDPNDPYGLVAINKLNRDVNKHAIKDVLDLAEILRQQNIKNEKLEQSDYKKMLITIDKEFTPYVDRFKIQLIEYFQEKIDDYPELDFIREYRPSSDEVMFSYLEPIVELIIIRTGSEFFSYHNSWSSIQLTWKRGPFKSLSMALQYLIRKNSNTDQDNGCP